MMKSDVLDTFDTIKACVAYKMNGVETNEFPYEIDDTIEPVYVELPGWKTDMTKMQSEDEFPEEFNAYLSFLEEELGDIQKNKLVINRTKWQKTTFLKGCLLPFLSLANFLSLFYKTK